MWARVSYAYPVLRCTLEETLECFVEVLGKPWPKRIFLWAKLVSGLSHNGVHNIESWNLKLWPTLRERESEREMNRTMDWSLFFFTYL